MSGCEGCSRLSIARFDGQGERKGLDERSDRDVKGAEFARCRVKRNENPRARW